MCRLTEGTLLLLPPPHHHHHHPPPPPTAPLHLNNSPQSQLANETGKRCNALEEEPDPVPDKLKCEYDNLTPGQTNGHLSSL